MSPTETTTRVRQIAPQDKPEVNLNLDALARETDSTPYAFVFSGKRYELQHAATIDAFQLFDAIGMAEPHATIETLRLALGSAQFEKFKAAHPPFGAMQKLVGGYFEYCGMSAGN